MRKEQLLTFVEDIPNDTHLKIYENQTAGGIHYLEFTFTGKDGNGFSFGLEEKNAALLFEGLCQIFENDDTNYQTDKQPVKNERNVLKDFFRTLQRYDKKHFEERNW